MSSCMVTRFLKTRQTGLHTDSSRDLRDKEVIREVGQRETDGTETEKQDETDRTDGTETYRTQTDKRDRD